MKEAQSELDILRDTVSKFDALGVHYMLTGSFAMNYYALPRMTRDIDMVVVLRAEDVPRVAGAFSADYYAPEPEIDRAVSLCSVFNLVHTASAIKIDCIVRKTGAYRELEFSRRRQVRFAGLDLWIVSKEDLVLSKLAWMRASLSELQMRDVRNLLATECDTGYLRFWAEGLGVAALLAEALHG